MNKQTQMILDAFTEEELREIRLALLIRSASLKTFVEPCESALEAITKATHIHNGNPSIDNS